MEDFVVPVFHHGGHFERDNNGALLYMDGKVERFPRMDIDLICFFDLLTLFKGLGYIDYKEMYWYDQAAGNMEFGLHPIKGDLEINQMREGLIKNKETDEMCIFFDHRVMETPVEEAVDEPVDEAGDEAGDESSNESSDDGYESTEDEPYRPPPPGFDDESSEEECVVLKKKPKRGGKKTESRSNASRRKQQTMKKKMSQKEVNKGSKTTKVSKTNNKPHVGPTTDGPHIRQSDDIGPKFSGPSAARHNHAGSSGGGPRMAGASDDEQEEAKEEVEPDPVFDYESETLVTPENSEDEREKYEFPQYNEASGFGDVYFELGMEFATIESFKNALKDHVIFEGRKIRYIKNDQRRVRCDCEHGVERIKKPRKSKKDNDASKENEESNKDNGEDAIDGDSGNVEERATVEEGHVDGGSKETAKETNDSTVVVSGTTQAIIPNPCPWLIYCAWDNQHKSYQIKTYVPNHTCGREFGSNMADQKWVAKKLEKRLLTQPHMTLNEAYEHIKIDYNVMINGKMIYRALKEARERVIGNEKAQYSKLRHYLLEILRSNPGSTALLGVTPIPESPPIFNNLYICLDACKRGFKAGCRKLIGLDGCFLKGYFGGQLLSAVGQDANNHFYVIAYAVVDSETKDNWKWFLTLLQEDLGDHYIHGWNFISDQQKGLLPALKEVMPHAHHRNCVRHIWKNFSNRFKDKRVKNMVWECAKCTTVSEFKASMERLRRVNEEAWVYLVKFDPACWTKSHFSHGPKADNLTNNLCEVWNAKIVNYRAKPILTMCEELRCYIMRRMTKYKQVLDTFGGTDLAPTQQKRLDDIMKEVKYWHPMWVGDDERRVFEVQRGTKKLSVDLAQNKCTCNAWQLTGIPCVHALAAIARRGDRPEGYVHPLLKIGAARATYQPCIQPVNSEEYWDKIEVINPIPPKLKRPVGRPVKRRKKEPSENETSGSKVKKTFRVTCSKCGETGHNQKTCKGPAAPNRRSTKLRRSTNAQSTAKTTNQAAEEMHVSQSAPQVQNVVDHPNPIQPTANAPGFVSSMGAANSGATIPHSARAKQPIVRPHYPAPVQSSTPPPIPPPRPSQGVSAATITAASKGTTSRMFQFIPNPGFKHPRQK